MTAKLALQADAWYNYALIRFCRSVATNNLRRDERKANFFRMDIIPQKRCSKCRQFFPATDQYFHRNISNKGGFQYQCRQCRSIAQPKEVIPDGYKQCSKCKHIHPATTEYFPSQKAYKGRKARLNSHCRQCKHDSDKTYAAENKSRIKEYKDQYNATHKEHRKQYDREHKERIDSLREEYTEANRDRIRRVHKEYCTEYYRTERGQIQQRISSHNRRARKRNAQGSYTVEELQEQYARQKGHCYYCNAKLGKRRNSYHADHIVPLARGGTNYIDNIVITCPDCNISKKDRLPHEWKRGGRLL